MDDNVTATRPASSSVQRVSASEQAPKGRRAGVALLLLMIVCVIGGIVSGCAEKTTFTKEALTALNPRVDEKMGGIGDTLSRLDAIAKAHPDWQMKSAGTESGDGGRLGYKYSFADGSALVLWGVEAGRTPFGPSFESAEVS